MNPIDDLVKLVAANPNVKDAELYKSFPQLKGTNLTRARAFALGKSRGYDEDELSEAFSDVIRLFAPKGTPMVKNVSYREVAPKPEPRPVSPIDALTPVDKINYKPAEQKQVEFDPEDPLGNIEKTVWEQSNELRKRRGEINSIYGKRDNTSNNIHLPDINNEVADIHFQEAELNKTYQQVKKTVEQTGLPLSEFDANEQLQKWAKTKDLNGLSIQQIGKQIPQTTTAKAVLKTYENYRDFNDAIKTSQSIEQAALIWKQSKLLKDPREAAKSEYEQLKTLTQRTDNHNLIPESKMGEVLAEFLMQPAAQEWSKQSQQNHQSYMGAYANLMNHYPSFAKGVMATKIANAREAKGWNNGFINFSSEKGNDEVVEELFKKGEITQQEKLFYDRNKSGVNSQVKTPGLVNSLARGFVHGMRNMAGTIEDVTGMLSSSDVLANKLQKESSESGLDVKGFHSFINSMGEFTGEMVPMMLLTKSLTGVGVSPAIANATSVGLLFEHPNREDAVSMFPGQPGKQVAYTAVKTAFDMGLGLLYDRSKALDGLLKEAQPQIKSIITEFSENKITAEAAKDAVKNTLSTYIEKARDLGIKTMQHNVKQSAQMAGFTVGKDILDNVFGGRDVSFSEMVLNAGESAKTAFVSGGLLSAMAAHGESKVPGRITSRQVYDIVSRPEYYKDLINRDHSLTKEQKAERLQNIEDGVSIFSDLNNETQLTEKQKAKVLLHELNQKVIDRKLEGLTSQGLIDKLKEQKKASAEIVTNIFKARDYQLSKVEEREAEKITEIKEEAPEVGGDTVDDIYFMSSKELIERKAEAKKEDKQRLIDAMGKEWHDKYLMADRETKSQMEDALTKEQKDIFGGVGLKDRDNPEVLQGLIRIVSALETVESKDVLASRARQAITDIVNGRNKKESFAILNAVSKRAEELGFSKNEMKEATINDFKERIDYEDAKDILNTFFGNGIEKSEVRIKKEQTYTTKSGKYSVEYENGKRVVKDKEGNTVPEYNGTTRNKVVYNVLKEHDEAYNFNHGEKADQSKAPQFNDPKEADRWVIENSTNPTEIAEIYQSNPKETHPLSAKEQAIADHGIGKVKESSYREFGDENNINNNKARAYFKKDGSTLDVIAKEISDRTGIEVEPHDIIEFIDRFPNGVSEALAKRDGEVRQAAATKFKELTGIDLTDRVAKNAALQGYEAEKIKQAEEALGKEIKSESLPEEELAKLLEEESRRIYEESENIDNLDTYATQSGEHTEPSPKNREQPQSESQIGQTTEREAARSGGRNLQEPAAEQATGKEIANKLREWASVIEGDKTALKSDLLALPKAFLSTTLKSAAAIIEAGGTIADAIIHAAEKIREYYNQKGKTYVEATVKEDLKALFHSMGVISEAELNSLPSYGASSKVSVNADTIGRIAEGANQKQSFGQIFKTFFQKNFTHHGLLPEWISGLREQAKGTASSYVRKAGQLADKLKQQMKQEKFNNVEDIDKLLRGENVAGIPASIETTVKEMRALIDGLSMDLVIGGYVTPEQALIIQKNLGTYLHRTYKIYNDKKWANKVPKKVLEDASEFLFQQAYAGLDPAIPHAERVAQAETIAKNRLSEILNGVDEVFGLRTKEGKKDIGILKERQFIPQEIRDLMGEYKDPGVAFAISIAKLASLKTNAAFLSKVRNMGMGNLFFKANDPNRPASHNTQIAGDGSKVWSPLNGLYTTPGIAKEFKDVGSTTSAGWQLYMKVVGGIRWGKTVLSPVTQVKNFESNIGFALMNGHLGRPEHFAQSFRFLGSVIGDKKNAGKAEPLVNKLLQLGLIDQSVNVQELRKMLRDDDLSRILTGGEKKSFGAGFLKNTYDYLNKTYSGADNFWKMFGFLAESDAIAQAKHGKPYKDLQGVEAEAVEQMAAERVKNTYPTYSRVWKGARAASENFSIFGNFISFQAESLRVFGNSIKYAVEDIRSGDPAMQKLGVARLVGGIIPYIGSRTMMNYFLAQMAGVGMRGVMSLFNDDEEDTKAADYNQYVPRFMRSANKMFINEGSGKFTVYDLSSVDPYGAIYKTINAFRDGSETSEEGGLEASLMELLSPFIEPEMLAGAIQETIANKDQYNRDIYNTDDSKMTKVGKSMGYIIDKMKPSILGIGERISETGDWQKELAALTGMRPYHIDINKGFGFKLKDAGQILVDIGADYRRAVYKKEEGAKKEAEARTKKVIEELHNQYLGAIRLGADPEVLRGSIIKQSAIRGYKNNVKAAILTGRIPEEGFLR